LPQHTAVSLRLTDWLDFSILRLRRRVLEAQPRAKSRSAGKAEPFRYVLRQAAKNNHPSKIGSVKYIILSQSLALAPSSAGREVS
jgi:hypothetical protein